MSDTDPTPETPVTIGDRLAWWRADLAARLDALRGTPAADLAQLLTELIDTQAAILALRGSPERTLADLAAELAALRGSPARNLADLYAGIYEGLYDTSNQTHYPAHYGISAQLDQIIQRLDYIQAGIGAVPYESLEIASTRGLLNSILRALVQQNEGIPPTTVAGDLADNGNAVYDGRKYALWLPPIDNITIASNGYDITANPNWSGWSAYIQTTDPAPRINTATDIANAWIQLVGTGSINFSVEAQYPIKVYLRRPATAGYVWYWDLAEIQQVSTFAGPRWVPVTTKYPALTFEAFANNPRVLSYPPGGSWAGWSWEITCPQPSSVYGTDKLNVVLSSGTGTIPSGTTNRWVVQTTTQPTAGTYIRIYPPAAS